MDLNKIKIAKKESSETLEQKEEPKGENKEEQKEDKE